MYDPTIQNLNLLPRNKQFNMRTQISRLPGVYFFLDQEKRPLYIGKALNIQNRMTSYFRVDADKKQQTIVRDASYISYIETDVEFTALLLEAALIRRYKPKYNILLKDDKHHLYIKITAKEEFPKVSTSRREDDAKALYFGPFPKSQTVKEVLRILRKVFPYCQQPRVGNRACFYSHLGLCNPCPSAIAHGAKSKKKELTRVYRRNIRRLIKVLKTEHPQVITDLTREMQKLAKAQKFEQAALIRNQIQKLMYITTQRYRISSFLENSNFLSQERQEEITQLRLMLASYFPNLKALSRIECFDISNLHGTHAVGSMVVFVDGVQDTAQYRRFKIKTIRGIDDVAMMGEVISRRIRHFDTWGRPNLIIVDGGKGHVNGARRVLAEQKISIPMIGLAKRFEQIIIPDSTRKYGLATVQLPLSHPAIVLLRKIRDEAHRFAVTYHKKLRRKAFV